MKPNPHHPTTEDLFAYRDGELPADRRSLIEAHVLVCAQCRDQIDAVSELESDLRLQPEGVGPEYFERMTESVLARIGTGAGATEAHARTAPPERIGGVTEYPAPRIERRRPDSSAEEIEPRGRFRLPWIGIAGTGAAAVAVVLVAVVLFHRQGEWLKAPRPSVLDESGQSAGVPMGDSAIARGDAKAAGETANAPPAAERSRIAGSKKKTDTLATLKRPQAVNQVPTAPMASRAPTFKDVVPGADLGARAEENKVRREAALGKVSVAQQSAPSLGVAGAAPGGAFGNVLRAHRLPPLWNPTVSRDALLAAEPDLRYIYQNGSAGSDSARIRLYLAEAERTRLRVPPDPEALGEVAHHYRRAIALAGNDPALASIARRRLEELLSSASR